MPKNALHTCKNVEFAKELIELVKQTGGMAAVIDFVNGRNELGQTPIHALMRSGPEGKPVVKYLMKLPEVDVNAIEGGKGTTMAHLCEDGEIMRYLATPELRPDFNPNIVNPITGQTILEYGVTYPKHPNLTEELLKCPKLVIDGERIDFLEQTCTNIKSIQSLELIRAEMRRRAIVANLQTQARNPMPGYANANVNYVPTTLPVNQSSTQNVTQAGHQDATPSTCRLS